MRFSHQGPLVISFSVINYVVSLSFARDAPTLKKLKEVRSEGLLFLYKDSYICKKHSECTPPVNCSSEQDGVLEKRCTSEIPVARVNAPVSDMPR